MKIMAYGILTNSKIKSYFFKKNYFLPFQNLNLSRQNGSTPLHKAVKAGNIQDVKMLFLHGVEINATDKFNRTPLHHAVLKNMVPIVKILLQNGADPDAADRGAAGNYPTRN